MPSTPHTTRGPLVRQLEDAGLLARVAAPDDHRGIIAQITPHGLEVFDAMERSHSASIRRHFAAHLADEDAHVIDQAFMMIGIQARRALSEQDE